MRKEAIHENLIFGTFLNSRYSDLVLVGLNFVMHALMELQTSWPYKTARYWAHL